MSTDKVVPMAVPTGDNIANNEEYEIEFEVSQLKNFFLRAIQVYDFIETPEGAVGWSYHTFLIASNFIYMIIIILETADGPNWYVHRTNVALYTPLPNATQYTVLKLFFSVPLIIHCLLRLFLATILHYFSSPFTSRSFTSFFSKTSNGLLCLWFWPLIISSIRPSLWPDDYMIFYHMIDFLRHLQILQTFKDVPSFVVVKETYRRVMRLVPIPIFVFFIINIFVGIILYLCDPCYNFDTCPFQNLFDSVIFSIVTMTTRKLSELNLYSESLYVNLHAFYCLLCSWLW
jgi:hypothetical protein